MGRLLWYGDRVKDLVRRSALAAAVDVAEKIFDESQTRVPVRTGFLRDSGQVNVIDENTVQVEYSADYAELVEYGTTLRPPRLYLTEAVISVEPQIKTIVEERMQKALSGGYPVLSKKVP